MEHPARLTGRRVRDLHGLLESSREKPPIKGFTAVIRLEDGGILLMSQSDVVEIEDWPIDAAEIPMQNVDGPKYVSGLTITAAFRTASDSSEAPQLWLLLNNTWVLGLVNTQVGSTMHIEPALSAPFARKRSVIRNLRGEEISLDSVLLETNGDIEG